MTSKSESNENAYIQQALRSFNDIMSNNHAAIVEKMNRTNKGELFVLHFLAMRRTKTLPSELSAALNSSTGRISALLGTLEKKGQIERNIDKSNRRNILVTITETGRNRVEAEMEKMKSSLTQVFTEMGETDTLEFVRLSKKFLTISQKYMPECEEEGKGVQSG